MFRPSKSLLFKPVAALNKLSIHQPLPLSQRESAKLLNLLTTSFRHNLDAEHPSFRTQEDASRTPRSSTRPRRHSTSDVERHPTDHHLHSVLSNPLLAPSHKIIHVGRDPTDVFDMAVANGMMSTNYAKACLKAMKDRIVKSPTLNIRDGMAESGLARKVIRWLVSSGTSNNNQFLNDEKFANLLMEFIVAEGLQEHAWKWIKRAFENLSSISSLPSGEAGTLLRREIAGPLRALVCAEIAQGVSLDEAYMCMSRAAGYLNGISASLVTTALHPAGLHLLRHTLMLNFSHRTSTESSFESFTSLVPIISPARADFYLAHLSLLHPTKPEASLAFEYLHTESSNRDRKYWESLTAYKRSGVIQLGLDTAKFLLERNQYSESERVMEFLSNTFPDQLGIRQKRELEQVKAEASSIELLSSFGIA